MLEKGRTAWSVENRWWLLSVDLEFELQALELQLQGPKIQNKSVYSFRTGVFKEARDVFRSKGVLSNTGISLEVRTPGLGAYY